MACASLSRLSRATGGRGGRCRVAPGAVSLRVAAAEIEASLMVINHSPPVLERFALVQVR